MNHQQNIPEAIPVANNTGANQFSPNNQVPDAGVRYNAPKQQSNVKQCIVWSVIAGFAIVLGVIVLAVVIGGGEDDELAGFEGITIDNIDAEVRNGDNHVGVLFAVEPPAAANTAFVNAANRWSDIVAGTLIPAVSVPGNQAFCGGQFGVRQSFTLDHLLIFAVVDQIDGENGILAFAGPCNVVELQESGQEFPIIGQMVFDVVDLQPIIDDGTLETVILHEMGHVLGIGTLFAFATQGSIDTDRIILNRFTLLQDPVINPFTGIVNGNNKPNFIGANAVSSFNSLGGVGDSVPLEDGIDVTGNRPNFNNANGGGSVDGHWNDAEFDNELMVFAIDASNAVFPLSLVTISALQDLGYTVDTTQADAFSFSSVAKHTSYSDKTHFLLNDVKVYTDPIKVD